MQEYEVRRHLQSFCELKNIKTMEVLRTSRNDLCFVIDHFIYKSDKKVKVEEESRSGTKHYCHCDRLGDGCHGRAIITIFSDGEKKYKLTKTHNGHAGRLMDTEATRFRTNLKASARLAPEKSSREIYDSVLASTLSQASETFHDEIVASIPDFQCMKSSLQRVRMEGRPTLPSTIEEVQIVGEWGKTLRGDRFLLFETPGSEKIVAFATDDMLKKLCESSLVIMDGTFRVSPSLFSQLYTLHGQYRGGVFCMMYLLLPNKRRDTYEEVLRLIKEAAIRIGKIFNPSKFLLDFEEAMILALQSQFPTSIVKGCFFHFTQAVWRNCQAIGLTTPYNTDHCVKRFVKGLMALPFVPMDQIQHALDILRNDLPAIDSVHRPLLDRLEHYFHRTWINGPFSPIIWNCHQNFSIRTTNHVEGWHRKLNAKVKVAHPTLYQFIRHLQEEESLVSNRMLELDNGHRLMPMVKKYRELNRRLVIVTTEFNNYERTLESFLSLVSNLLFDPYIVSRT